MTTPEPPAAVAGPTRELFPGVIEVDTLLGGWRQTTAGYLIGGGEPVLIETGSQTSVPAVLASLEALGIGAEDLRGIAVTHIHLDHAGGVGDVARAFPNATVYVHEKGARHLADPTRLVDSASRVYGPLLDSLYGRLDPTPPERIHVLEDGEVVEIGDRRLVAIDSPGHAKHHLGFLDETSGLLFAGDAVGVKLPGGGALRPATPPPDFDLELAVASLHRFADHSPYRIALTHYGVIETDPLELLREAEETVRSWAEVAEAAWRADTDIAAALQASFAADLSSASTTERGRLNTLNGIHSNASGLRRWLEQRDRPVGAAEH